MLSCPEIYSAIHRRQDRIAVHYHNVAYTIEPYIGETVEDARRLEKRMTHECISNLRRYIGTWNVLGNLLGGKKNITMDWIFQSSHAISTCTTYQSVDTRTTSRYMKNK